MEQRCTPTAKIVPLTNDKDTLLDAIDALKDGGSTAGQLGTAFAWYLLSPKWADIWPAESKPAAYGTEKLRKIAVLMTDGEYNTLQGVQYSDGSSQATTALNKAKALCTAMKKKSSSSDPNIEIYTVGFQLDSAGGIAMLKSCATDDSHFYQAATGDELKQAFRDIALKIAWLRLTN
jgi:hypothetical protein